MILEDKNGLFASKRAFSLLTLGVKHGNAVVSNETPKFLHFFFAVTSNEIPKILHLVG